jgi:chromosomal replication initiation ATPase DnaA
MNYLTIISELTGIPPKTILSNNRIPKVNEARQLCMYFYRNQNGISEAGRILRKNHGTVQHGFNRISELLEVKDKRTVELVSEIKSTIRKEINF